MRLYARLPSAALLVVVVAAVAAPTAAAAPALPQVLVFGIPSSGPGDLLVLISKGFVPGETAQVRLVDTSDRSRSFAAVSIVANSNGVVSSPSGYRSPEDVVPGTYTLRVSQRSGAVATSAPVTIVAPNLLTISEYLGPGATMGITLTGLAGNPAITRSFTVDGSPLRLSAVTETAHQGPTLGSVEGSLTVPATLPSDLRPGLHRMTLRQGRAPVITVQQRFQLFNPSVSASSQTHSQLVGDLSSRDTVSVDSHYFGPAGASLSVTGADGVEHMLGDLDSRGSATVVLPGLPAGEAVFTATSPANGTTAHHTSTVVASTLTAPTSLGYGGALISPSGRVVLLVGFDGEITVQRDGFTVWSNHVTGQFGYQPRLVAQPDGNLVEYRADGSPLWSSGTTASDSPITITVLDDGRAVLTTAHGAVLWSTPAPATPTLVSGD